MRKINYPSKKKEFENEYYNSLNKAKETDINAFLQSITSSSKITFQSLITAQFEKLVEYHHVLENHFKTRTASEVENFKKCFDYPTNQPDIAFFFMTNGHNIDMKTCFYCNIDFINAFNDLGEYNSTIDFINKSSLQELKIILSDDKAKLINNKVKNKNISNINELLAIKNIGIKTIDKIKNIKVNDLKKMKNHFTLDHFIPQSKYPYFALSLYNLIPSCYSCNSKFKKATNFSNINNLKYLSPSSNSFSLSDSLEFKIYYNVSKTKKSPNIILSEICIDIENTKQIKEFDTYLDMFKLKGRYLYHKSEALKLINKRSKYSDTEINEISKIVNRNINDIKKDIFGSLIFNDNEKNEPFAKYKKDIAKQLGII